MPVLTATITLSAPITCSACATPFAMAESLAMNLYRSHKSFYCPNGHALAFKGESDIEKANRLLAWERDRAAALMAERDGAQASLRTTKGHVTRLRKRAASGECPFGCGRRFAGLTEHIAKVHPDQLLDGE